MELDRNEKVTKEIYREALFDAAETLGRVIECVKKSTYSYETPLNYAKLAKIRLDCIEKLYQLDNSEE